MPIRRARSSAEPRAQVVTVERLGDWARAWDSLVDALAAPSPFLRSWWLDAVADGEPVTVLVVAGDELWGGLALQRDRLAGVERLRFRGAGALQPDHLDLVARRDRVHEVVAALSGWLGRSGDRLIDLEGLDADAWLLDAVPGRGELWQIETAPFVLLPGDIEAFMAARPGQLRSTIKRTGKRLDRDGVATRRVALDEFDRGLADLRRLHDGRWGEESGFLDRWEAFEAAMWAGAERGEVWLTELATADGEVVATEIDLVVGRRVSFYQAGRRTEREWRGAGSVLRARIIGEAIDAGAVEFDLLRGGENYKSDWSSGSRPVFRVRRGVGLRGSVLAAGLALNRRRAARADGCVASAPGGGGPSSTAVVVYSDAEQLGGAERQTMQLLNGLAPEFEVTVVGVDRAVVDALAAARPGSSRRLVRPIRHKADLAAIAQHRHVFAEIRPRIVHAQLGHGSSCQYAMIAALSVPGARVVATEHSPMGVWSRSSRWVKRWTVPRLAAHVAVGRAAAGLVAADVGVDPASIRVIPNGVGSAEVEAVERITTRPTVGVVARFDPVKGVDVAIEAMGLVPDADLVVLGDGPLRPEIERQISAAGIADRVHVVGWVDEPRAWYPTFDVVLLPSRLEGMPIAVIEAMLAGRAVVATDVGSVGEVVLDGVTGLVLAPDDPVAMASAVRSLLADPTRAAVMGEAGRTRALEHFSSRAVVSAYEALYREILG